MDTMREYARIGKEEEEQAGAIEGGSRSGSSSEDTAIWSPWFTETEDLRHTNYNNKMAMTMTETKRFIYSPEEIKNNLIYPLVKHYMRGLEEKKEMDRIVDLVLDVDRAKGKGNFLYITLRYKKEFRR